MERKAQRFLVRQEAFGQRLPFQVELEFCKVSLGPIGQSHDQTVGLSP
jgi:hypothetical protein